MKFKRVAVSSLLFATFQVGWVAFAQAPVPKEEQKIMNELAQGSVTEVHLRIA